MTEYPSNRQQAPKKVQADKPEKQAQVTTGKVIVKKPSLGKRFAANFTGEDGKSVAQHVFWEVLMPAAKDAIYDAGQEALGRVLGVDTRGGRRSSAYNTFNTIGSTLASRVNYNKPGFMQDPRQQQQPRTAPTRGNVGIQDIILATRVEAEEVIDRMQSLCTQYGQATIADLFDLVGVTGQYTDEKFGWQDMTGARPHHTRDGYLLNLPRPVQLD